MEGYRRACVDVIERRFEGHIVHYKGDGVLSAFGYPGRARERRRAGRARGAGAGAGGRASVAQRRDRRAARRSASASTTAPSTASSTRTRSSASPTNIGARYETLAAPGTVVVSDEVRQLVEAHFELEAGEPQHVKGTPEPLQPFRVVRERHVRAAARLAGAADRPRRRAARALRAAAGLGGPTGVLVWGEPGVGKSRLVAALTDELDAGAVVLHGSPFHADAGLHPVRGLLEARCGLRPDATAAGAARRPRRGGRGRWAGRRRRPAAGAGARARARRRLRARRGRGTAARGAGRPDRPGLPEGLRGRVVVAEDLHWFDDATRALLARIARDGRVRRGHLAALRARQLGGDRAAAAGASRTGSR